MATGGRVMQHLSSSGSGSPVMLFLILLLLAWVTMQLAVPARRARWLARAGRLAENDVVRALRDRAVSDVRAVKAEVRSRYMTRHTDWDART